MRSMYQMKTVDGVICIMDLGGDKSATNDMEDIVDDLGRAGIRLDGPVIYRDSDGIWDEVLVQNNTFRGFRSLNKHSEAEAVAAVK